MSERISVLIGTTKGVFILRSDAARRDWALSGPLCEGWPCNHVIGDPATGDIWAAAGGEWNGSGVWRSTDGGATWELSLLANGEIDAFLAQDAEFAKMLGHGPSPDAPYKGQITGVWSLGFEHDTLYLGTKPAALLASTDRGQTWAKVQGLSDHPSADGWQPGGAGLVLHSIVGVPDDPQKLWVGISAAGVFATEDGGATWDRRNRRSNAASAAQAQDAPTLGECGHEVGHCVHNIVRADQAAGDLLYQQNHEGVFRSKDGGRSWDDIAQGLPSKFGFPIAVHPHDPQTLWVLPLNGDMQGRFPPDASAAVWRSRDGGQTWQDLRQGLPGENCFFTVLRQAMATDQAAQAGVYFGTNTGSLFASRDEGDTWTEIARHLPTILGVEVMHQR
ncbi:WD40/YVTN/BNR-like repeat-containing protein [Pararhodobacter oceanensis]|uniref:Glycoside hydrolase n=1 Tax=Pararhodobacter oceanensis TaxID=2172121 RepID=A0A2T8HQV9_9RHOB|nr:sialidase family protein [Pararhodobacter oceanensis]PVH27839.1 glycoside hydrolase [Pararhodobacter oceanensis]